MKFNEAMMRLKQRKTVARPGRKLRLFAVGFADVTEEAKRTEITAEDLAAEDWEAVEE
jgi:hypothetical protein